MLYLAFASAIRLAYSDDMDTPREIVIRGIRIFAGGQALACVVLCYAFTAENLQLAKMMCAFALFWGPWVLVCSWRMSKTAWEGAPSDDLNDVSWPSLPLFIAVVAFYNLVS